MSGLSALHILLVDDNPNMRAIVQTMLRSVGIMRISEAENSAQAQMLMRQFNIDIAIVDFRMDGLDGVGFTRLVRHDENSPDPYLPIIMMTGHSERTRVTEARDAGVTEFVTKPIDSASLLKRLEAVIMRPRPFVRSVLYFGPDRRRLGLSDYNGPWRRTTDTSVLLDYPA